MKPLPTVVTAYDYLLQQEQKIKTEGSIGKQKSGQSVALAVGSGNSSGSNDTPPRSYDRPEGDGERPGGLFCNYCKKTNHVIKDCWRLKKKRQDKEGMPRNRFAGSVGQGSGSEEGQDSEGRLQVETSSLHQNSGGFTVEEMNRLRGLLQSSTSTSPTSPQSPVINHRSHSVTNYLPKFPSHADDWFGDRK
ncbi:unnamed protein product [Linum trigynum]|uniref:Uncharacterized protein n=1 Tax=Linum trigynum TaxID=586398 RepID=A0AAV2EVW8_9ROSI